LRYSQPNKIIVSRIKNFSPENGHSITTIAKDYLRRKIPFDNKGDYENDDQLYCTELIWRILEKDLNFLELPKEEAPRKKLFYTMNGLYDAHYFDVILNQYQQKIVD
ncbi:MAG: hypothetical protein ACK4UK_01360, partial [Flavobacterium sp.]